MLKSPRRVVFGAAQRRLDLRAREKALLFDRLKQ
jgi:hypothetical protein